jgi:hypothetical protein
VTCHPCFPYLLVVGLELLGDVVIYQGGVGEYHSGFRGCLISDLFVQYPTSHLNFYQQRQERERKKLEVKRLRFDFGRLSIYFKSLVSLTYYQHVCKSQWWRTRQVSISLCKSWSPIPSRSCASSSQEGQLRPTCRCWCSRLVLS